MIALVAREALRQHPRRACMLAFLSGALLVAAFSPLDAFPLGLIAPALLVYLWFSARGPREAAWIGFAFGMGLFGVGVSWVYVSLSQFGGMPVPLAALATLAFCAFLALFPAAVGYAQHRIGGRERLRALLAIPALWVLSEWLRGVLMTGFPWLALGYAAVSTPLAGFAPLFGVYGASLLAMICAGLAWATACQSRRAVSFALLAAIVIVGALLRGVAWTAPVGAPLSASLLQGNVSQELKFDPERYARTLATYLRLAEESRAQLVVLPETAVPRFLDRVDPDYLARLEAIATRNGGDLLLGVPVRSGPGEYFNSVISLGSSPRQSYHKQHLVPFGEFVPPGFGWIGSVLSIPLADFSRGAPRQPPLGVAGQRVALNICYEDAFGGEIIRSLPEATLLVNVSNVAWFGDSLAPGQHLQIARMRSIETGRATLSATNTGITAAIDRDGRILARLPQFAEGRLEAAVRGYQGATPYVRFGDWPALLAAAGMLVALSLLARRR